jgi:hypothetical protein
MLFHDGEWQEGQTRTVAAGGAGRRPAKNAGRPMNQSREAHTRHVRATLPKGGLFRLLPQRVRLLLCRAPLILQP